MLTMSLEPKKDWTLRDWLANFLEDPHPYYGDGGDDEYADSALPDGMPGGDDDYYDDIDESLVESFIIIGLAATLAFLVYYRNQRQAGHRRAAEQQEQQAQAGGVAVADQPQPQVVPAQQADGGFFPPPDDPNYGVWVAGGVGH